MFNRRYFKGWYFKCCSGDKTVAFIPAYHQSGNKKTASLQIITDHSAFNIPFETFSITEKPLLARLGKSIFSQDGIDLNLKTDKLTAAGKLRFSKPLTIKYDIMGPFKLVPFMQCRHSVYSMLHRVNGSITLNGQQFDFKNGNGYMEGDCGYSFPEKYIWTQCCFENNSLMLSVAHIPFCGFNFVGIIGIVMMGKKEYRIATYLGAKLKSIKENTVTVIQGDYELTARLIEKKAQPLFAPHDGRMTRTIHESASCKAYYRFSYKGKNICDFTSDKASFEFEYI